MPTRPYPNLCAFSTSIIDDSDNLYVTRLTRSIRLYTSSTHRSVSATIKTYSSFNSFMSLSPSMLNRSLDTATHHIFHHHRFNTNLHQISQVHRNASYHCTSHTSLRSTLLLHRQFIMLHCHYCLLTVLFLPSISNH